MAMLTVINSFGCGEVEDDISTGEDEITVGEDETVTEDTTNGEDTVSIATDSGTEEDISNLEAIITDATADSEDCAIINDIDIKKTCEQGFIYKQAVSEKDKDMCGELENITDQEMCVAEIGE